MNEAGQRIPSRAEGLTSNTTLDFTVNPDFGQVEAAPSVVNLTAFETFYPEKRPFFVEGARVFDMPITSFGTSAIDRLFYSRRIGRAPHYDPPASGGEFLDVPDRTSILGAAKITGKTSSGLSLGVLNSVTGEERATIAAGSAERPIAVEPLTNYFVARLQKDYRQGQTLVGGMATAVNRRLDEPQFDVLHESAYTWGGDFTHYWRDRAYYARGAAVFSYVQGSPAAIARTQRASPRFFQRPDASYLNYDPTRTSLAGNGGSLEVGRSGNSRFLINGSLAWRSPSLELNDVGYQRTANYIVTRVQADYNEFQPFWVFRTFNMSGAFWVNHVYSGQRTGLGGYGALNVQFRNFWRLSTVYETNSEYLETTLLRGGPAMMTSARSQANLFVRTDQRRKLNASFQAGRLFDPNGEEDQRWFGVGVFWRPSTALDVSLQPNVTLRDPRLQYVGTASADGSPRYVLAGLEQLTVSLTARVNYAITPTLTVQFYGQPFVSTGAYTDFKQVSDPRAAAFANRFYQFPVAQVTRGGGIVGIDENGDGMTDYRLGDPDYGFRQFRSNLVVRWEYRPGSTFFVVWSQGRTGMDRDGTFSFGGGMRDLFRVAPENVFLVKFSRLLAW